MEFKLSYNRRFNEVIRTKWLNNLIVGDSDAMPFLDLPNLAGQKRKHVGADSVSGKKVRPSSEASQEQRILELEAGIIKSRKNFNDIAELTSLARNLRHERLASTASVSLCRVFSSLLAAGNLTRSKAAPESELVILDWLKKRYQDYKDLLSEIVANGSTRQQADATVLILNLVKEESLHLSHQSDAVWRTGLFANFIKQLIICSPQSSGARDLFIESYLKKYDDIRYWTWKAIEAFLDDVRVSDDDATADATTTIFELLMAIDPPSAAATCELFYGRPPESKSHAVCQLTAHKKQAQITWNAFSRLELSKSQRKTMLSSLRDRIVPWLTNVDVLMDFLSESYSVGGGTSLLALSGLYYLIEKRNLDYPSFYPKLYSLLDQGLLHSKYRSRFFRLLDVFLSSSHLPAQLVASFVKRLARLALHAPPAGIVAVVPWIYNTLKAHPQCTFMIHRDETSAEPTNETLDDCFDMDETDPLFTNALDSSLWEIETLQSHYHPNVAALAKIISQPFTKESYNLEDFLDHSYDGLLDAELRRDLKKPPVIEWEIPKRILTSDDDGGLNTFGMLLQMVVESDGTI